MEIYHKLKLYSEVEPGNQSTKKPVRAPYLCPSLVAACCMMLVAHRSSI